MMNDLLKDQSHWGNQKQSCGQVGQLEPHILQKCITSDAQEVFQFVFDK